MAIDPRVERFAHRVLAMDRAEFWRVIQSFAKFYADDRGDEMDKVAARMHETTSHQSTEEAVAIANQVELVRAQAFKAGERIKATGFMVNIVATLAGNHAAGSFLLPNLTRAEASVLSCDWPLDDEPRTPLLQQLGHLTELAAPHDSYSVAAQANEGEPSPDEGPSDEPIDLSAFRAAWDGEDEE